VSLREARWAGPADSRAGSLHGLPSLDPPRDDKAPDAIRHRGADGRRIASAGAWGLQTVTAALAVMATALGAHGTGLTGVPVAVVAPLSADGTERLAVACQAIGGQLVMVVTSIERAAVLTVVPAGVARLATVCAALSRQLL
jgi:hypothetical protein